MSVKELSRRSASAAALLVFAACHDRIAAPAEASYSMAAAGGDKQHGPAGSVLPQPLAVLVRDAGGSPVKGAVVVFRVQRGAATGSRVRDSVGVTSPAGVATTELQLGNALDTTIVVAYPAPASQRSVSLSAIATAAPALTTITPATFGASDTLTLRGTGLAVMSAGGVVQFDAVPVAPLPGGTDGALRVVVPPCLAPGAIGVRVVAGPALSNSLPATYQSRSAVVSLAPFQSITVSSAQLADCLTLQGLGAAYVVVPQFASVGSPTALIDWRLTTTALAGSSMSEATAPSSKPGNPAQRDFEAVLRQRERASAPQARAEAAERGRERPSFTVVPVAAPALGTLRAFRAIAALDGTQYTDVVGRLKYAGQHLLLYVDTVGSGFSDPQYVGLGTLFDQDLYPIAVNAFGSESDLDHDGRILVLFTPAVNRLVPAQRCGQFGYVTGFFDSNDLLVHNPNSNKAEMFFSFIPDTAGVYSCKHLPDDVLRILPGTFIHELQHMISFNQHVLARSGDTEDVWLNEGLSHIAEELASKYYEARFPAPAGRSTTEQLFPDSAGPFIAPQLLNAYAYLISTRAHSVTSYNGTGSIEERGASWLFLRWLADQKGEDLFCRLVQTSKTGIANVEDKAAEPFGALFGDFSLALYTDSLLGLPRTQVPPRLQFTSRDLRKLMAREATISGFTAAFPLPLFSLSVGGFLQSSMLPGTMTHTFIQTASTRPAITLRLSHQDLSDFAAPVAAQVSIFRLP
ncbi:MAG: hypothetical protein ACHQQ3_10995 [Gemmatimonadales bacterium]